MILVKTAVLWAERVKGGQVGVKLLIVVEVSRIVCLHGCEHRSSQTHAPIKRLYSVGFHFNKENKE